MHLVSETISLTTYEDPSSTGWLDLVLFFQRHLSFSMLQTCFQRNAVERDSIVSDVISTLLRILSVKACKISGSTYKNDMPTTFAEYVDEGNDQDYSDSKPKQPYQDNHNGEEIYYTTVQNVNVYLDDIWNGGFNSTIVLLIKEKLQQNEWRNIVPMYSNLAIYKGTCDKIGITIANETVPTLFQRLVADLPPATPELCGLLSNLARMHKIAFYKPVIACIASNSENKVVKSLVLIICLRQYLTGVQMWMRDAEMMSVIILGDVGGSKSGSQHSVPAPAPAPSTLCDGSGIEEVSDASSFISDNALKAESWRTTTLGQCAVVAEFIWAIKELRNKQKDRKRDMGDDEAAKKFLLDFERQLSIILTAKEKTKLIPLPLRVLIANMFSEIRFFCNTTHEPGWLSRAIEWCTHMVAVSEFYQDTSIDNQDTIGDVSGNNAGMDIFNSVQHSGYLDDVSLMFQRLRMVYATLTSRLDGDFDTFDFDRPVSVLPRRPTNDQQWDHSGQGSSSRSSTVLDIESAANSQSPVQIQRIKLHPTSASGQAALDISPPPIKQPDQDKSKPMVQADKPLYHAVSQLSKQRLSQVADLNQDPYGSVLSLLVAVFATISEKQLSKLAEPLWRRFMDDKQHQAFPAAAFLLMQCGEKAPQAIVNLTSTDLYR